MIASLQIGNLAIFSLGNFQFWQLSISKLSLLKIFNLGYFQAKLLNGSQKEQHINFMDFLRSKIQISSVQDK